MQRCQMDAVLLPSSSSSSADLTKYDGSSRIFLENLPIDITEEELTDALAFCGKVKVGLVVFAHICVPSLARSLLTQLPPPFPPPPSL